MTGSEHLPYSREGTSHEAAHSMEDAAGAIRERIYRHLCEGGATCDEIEVWAGLRHQTASARINELWKGKRIFDSGKTRPTRSGRKAIVWIVPVGQMALNIVGG